jgi:hypothetical protein
VDRVIEEEVRPEMLRASSERSPARSKEVSVSHRAFSVGEQDVSGDTPTIADSRAIGSAPSIFARVLDRLARRAPAQWIFGRRIGLHAPPGSPMVMRGREEAYQGLCIDPAFLDHDLKQISAVREFFNRDRAAEAWLAWNREDQVLAINAVWPGAEPRPTEVDIEFDQLECALLSGQVRNVIWLNDDQLGIGSAPPFHKVQHLVEFSAVACHQPQSAIDLLFPGGWSSQTWIKRVVTSGRPLRPFVDASDRNVEMLIAPSSVKTRLRFYPGHQIDMALDGRDDSYAAAVEGQPLPHVVQFLLGRPKCVVRIELGWESAENLADEFSVTLRRGKHECWSFEQAGSDSAILMIDVPMVEADSIALAVARFKGQDRLLLRTIRILAVPTSAAGLPK